MKQRFAGERGSTLILLIGIIATLAIMSVSLVVLTGNVAHNTSMDRGRARAFHVAEAALDRGMFTISDNWMSDQAAYDAWVADGRDDFYTSFRADFPSDEFRDPTSGQFVTIDFVDNLSPIDFDVHYDSNEDERMYVVAQSGTGDSEARIMAMVERTFMDMQVPRGVALYATGNLLSNGIGNNPKIIVEVPPPAGTDTVVRVGGYIDQPGFEDPDRVSQSPPIIDMVGGAAGSIDDVFPQSLVDALKATAQANGRYFTTLAAATSSPADPEWSPQGGISGLCVIEAGPGVNLKMTGNVTINSEEEPGVLMVIGGASVEWGGNADFYGILYCEGDMATGHGTADIHGMVINNGGQELKGTPNIRYNDTCIANLMQRFAQNVKLVPNTWRELKPQ